MVLVGLQQNSLYPSEVFYVLDPCLHKLAMIYLDVEQPKVCVTGSLGNAQSVRALQLALQ